MRKIKSQSLEKIRMTEEYLRGYTLNRRLVELDSYEKRFFGVEESEWEREAPQDLPLARAKMFEIKHFVLGLANSDEKLLLYYHYIKGQSMDHCAELLGVSRSTAYRIKERALNIAAERYIKDA